MEDKETVIEIDVIEKLFEAISQRAFVNNKNEITPLPNALFHWFVVSDSQFSADDVESFQKQMFVVNERRPQSFYIGCVHRVINKVIYPLYLCGTQNPEKGFHMFGEKDASMFLDKQLNWYIYNDVKIHFTILSEHLDYPLKSLHKMVDEQVKYDWENRKEGTVWESLPPLEKQEAQEQAYPLIWIIASIAVALILIVCIVVGYFLLRR